MEIVDSGNKTAIVKKQYLELRAIKIKKMDFVRRISDSHFENLGEMDMDTDRLKKISFNREFLTSAVFLHLQRYSWKNLQAIELKDNKITAKGCTYLTAIPLPELRKLSLSSNQIDAGGVIHLSKGLWKRIQVLQIQILYFERTFFKYITKGNWTRLTWLAIRYSSPNEMYLEMYNEFIVIEAPNITSIAFCNQKFQVTNFFKNLLNRRRPNEPKETYRQITLQKMKAKFISYIGNID